MRIFCDFTKHPRYGLDATRATHDVLTIHSNSKHIYYTAECQGGKWVEMPYNEFGWGGGSWPTGRRYNCEEEATPAAKTGPPKTASPPLKTMQDIEQDWDHSWKNNLDFGGGIYHITSLPSGEVLYESKFRNDKKAFYEPWAVRDPNRDSVFSLASLSKLLTAFAVLRTFEICDGGNLDRSDFLFPHTPTVSPSVSSPSAGEGWGLNPPFVGEDLLQECQKYWHPEKFVDEFPGWEAWTGYHYLDTDTGEEKTGARLKLRDLLTQTSGLDYPMVEGTKRVGPRSMKLLFTPGTAFAYSIGTRIAAWLLVDYWGQRICTSGRERVDQSSPTERTEQQQCRSEY